jgi:enoyl-CoA hydratase/carnithine racemase
MAVTAPPEDLWAVLAERKETVFTSADAKEGSRAFMEKRDPVWTGS